MSTKLIDVLVMTIYSEWNLADKLVIYVHWGIFYVPCNSSAWINF